MSFYTITLRFSISRRLSLLWVLLVVPYRVFRFFLKQQPYQDYNYQQEWEKQTNNVENI